MKNENKFEELELDKTILENNLKQLKLLAKEEASYPWSEGVIDLFDVCAANPELYDEIQSVLKELDMVKDKIEKLRGQQTKK